MCKQREFRSQQRQPFCPTNTLQLKTLNGMGRCSTQTLTMMMFVLGLCRGIVAIASLRLEATYAVQYASNVFHSFDVVSNLHCQLECCH